MCGSMLEYVFVLVLSAGVLGNLRTAAAVEGRQPWTGRENNVDEHTTDGKSDSTL